MKKIGLLGGVGPQATAFIYERVIAVAKKAYNAKENDDFPSIVIASVPVPDFISDTTNLDTAKRMLIEAAKGLESAGCDALCIGSNTVHVLLDELKKSVKIPFISMVELVADECASRGVKSVALLGTPTLLGSDLYDKALSARSISLVKPSSSQIEICDRVIRSVIAGESVEPLKPQYVEVISSMFGQNADAVILGCTELPLVMDYEVLGNKILSSDVILADGIAAYCYERAGS